MYNKQIVYNEQQAQTVCTVQQIKTVCTLQQNVCTFQKTNCM